MLSPVAHCWACGMLSGCQDVGVSNGSRKDTECPAGGSGTQEDRFLGPGDGWNEDAEN